MAAGVRAETILERGGHGAGLLQTASAQTRCHQATPVWDLLPLQVFWTGWNTAHTISICCYSSCCKSCRWKSLTGSDHQFSKSRSNPLLWLVPEVSHESRRTCSSWKSICYLSAKPRTESDDSLGADLWEALMNVAQSNDSATLWKWETLRWNNSTLSWQVF